jgi:hypothetical protein
MVVWVVVMAASLVAGFVCVGWIYHVCVCGFWLIGVLPIFPTCPGVDRGQGREGWVRIAR